jgi:FkbM family methyltransferase
MSSATNNKLARPFHARFRKWLLPLTSIVEIQQHYVLASALSTGSVILDLGANVGGFAEDIISRFGCQVISVEPEQSNFEAIFDHPNLRKIRGAIGGKCGQFGLRVSTDPTGHRIELQNDSEAAAVATEQVITVHDFTSLTTLASVREIALMKIDVEGCEWDWLDTISDEQLSRIGQLTIEFHDFVPELRESNRTWPAYERLMSLGFYCIEDPEGGSYNVLFANRRLKVRKISDRLLLPLLDLALRAGWKLERLQKKLFRSH